MKKVIVLGAGRIGKTIATDLCEEYSVTATDIDGEKLESLKEYPAIYTVQMDLSEKEALQELVTDYDLVIGALPGSMGFNVLSTIIWAGKNIVDISFFEEDPFQLDEFARRQGVTAAIDCGIAPGLSNVVLGYHARRMEVESYTCFVGGLPVKRSWPFEYRALFSPIDVLEEYIRPARVVENGSIVTRPALSEVEIFELEGIGTLEAFNTDGLRTLLKTMNIPNMKEKTLRYPGHAYLMRVLRDVGFFGKSPLDLPRGSVRPIDLTAKLLFPWWQLKENEEDFTVMRLVIEGKESGKKKRYVYNLLDKYDKNSRTPSMARITGYTCTAVARLILRKQFTPKGVIPPEYIGFAEECFGEIMADLQKRHIQLLVEF